MIVFGGACAVLCAFPVKKFRTEYAPHLNNRKDAPLAFIVCALRVIRHPHYPVYLLSPGHTGLALIKILYYPGPLGLLYRLDQGLALLGFLIRALPGVISNGSY